MRAADSTYPGFKQGPITFVGWYYDSNYDWIDAVFRDPEGTDLGYFAYTHIGQHGELEWPPFGKKVSFEEALKLDPNTVQEVLERYGDVPGVRPKRPLPSSVLAAWGWPVPVVRHTRRRSK